MSDAPTPKEILDLPDERIAMPDGTRLAARLWRPATGGPVPAILEFIPYRKGDGTRQRDERMHPWWAARGYACLRVDLRGSGDSEGLLTDEYTGQELQDACDIIAWAAAQPWCTGRVGMMGKSWGGFNCLQSAALRPPALGAVLSVCSTADRFADDIHFKGGALLGENIGWGAVMLSFSSRPADPLYRPDWRADWMARLEAEPFLAPLWAGHQAKDAYWKHGSVGEDWGAIQAPVMVIGGWADNYMNTVAALVENLSVPVQGIVGPWGHQYPHSAEPGPRIGFLEVALRWWDRWLKDVPNGAEGDPAYRVWMQHSCPPDASAPHRVGHWVAEAALPSPRVTVRDWPLSPGGVLGGDGGDIGAVVSSPQHLGLMAGEFFPMGLDAEMAGDQAEDDALSVCFTSDPLTGTLSILGAAEVRLTLQSDLPRAILIARLCDVAPDGASTRIAHGILNLCHRDSMEHPSDVPVGVPFDVTLRLDQCAHRLAPGHRLRVALSTSYWPFVWPSAVTPRLEVMTGKLALPVHEATGDADEWAFPAAHVPETLPVTRYQDDHALREIQRDLISGKRMLLVLDHSGPVTHSHGLTATSSMTETWTISPNDPASAEVVIHWSQALWRDAPAWRVDTEVKVRMTATPDALRMTATLQAQENLAEVFRRDWDEAVPRVWL
ncbi:MAG: CocE/NonD family hydrolase [Gemmobacter sp.]